jgi:GNAT superfamily N-acetyltransferase
MVHIRRIAIDSAAQLQELRITVDRHDPGPLGHPSERLQALDARAIEDLLLTPEACTFGAFDGHALLGASSVQPTPTSSQWHGLFWLAVHPLARGRGIGKQLVVACLRHADVNSAHGVILTLNRPNPGAEKLYRAEGFVEWSAPAPSYTYNGTQYEELHLRKLLRGA